VLINKKKFFIHNNIFSPHITSGKYGEKWDRSMEGERRFALRPDRMCMRENGGGVMICRDGKGSGREGLDDWMSVLLQAHAND
jgi:hypothetical protein